MTFRGRAWGTLAELAAATVLLWTAPCPLGWGGLRGPFGGGVAVGDRRLASTCIIVGMRVGNCFGIHHGYCCCQSVGLIRGKCPYRCNQFGTLLGLCAHGVPGVLAALIVQPSPRGIPEGPGMRIPRVAIWGRLELPYLVAVLELVIWHGGVGHELILCPWLDWGYILEWRPLEGVSTWREGDHVAP